MAALICIGCFFVGLALIGSSRADIDGMFAVTHRMI